MQSCLPVAVSGTCLTAISHSWSLADRGNMWPYIGTSVEKKVQDLCVLVECCPVCQGTFVVRHVDVQLVLLKHAADRANLPYAYHVTNMLISRKASDVPANTALTKRI